MLTIGTPHDRFDDVREVAVLRGGGLGDLLFAVPAIDALRAAYPEARITLLGTPVARALLPGLRSVDALEVLPFVPGVRDGDAGPDDETAEDFVARLHGRFDLVVQAHGGGRNANPFLARLGARHTVGTATPDAEVPERWIRYEYYQHEVVRWLEVAGLAGAAATTLDPVVVVDPADVAAARARLLARAGDGRADAGADGAADPTAAGASDPTAAGAADPATGAADPTAGAADPMTGRAADRTVVVLHPGATDPRRRWPEERFAAVAADRLDRGDVVVLVGDHTDVPAAAEIGRLLVAQGTDVARLVDLTGSLPLTELPAVLAAADVMVADDSGPRHLALAVGTPTVGVFWFGNVVNAGPFDRARHRVLIAYVTRCPVCGIDVTQVGWTAERCEHDPSFVAEIRHEDVLTQVEDLLATVPRRP